VKIATEFCKDVKAEYSTNVKKLASYLNLREAFEDTSTKNNRFVELVRSTLRKGQTKN